MPRRYRCQGVRAVRVPCSVLDAECGAVRKLVLLGVGAIVAANWSSHYDAAALKG